MTRSRRSLVVIRALGAWSVALAALIPSVAGAATIDSHPLAGFQSSVSCLTTSECVAAGYDTHSVGDVVDVTNGVPGRITPVSGTDSVYDVSCAGATGCVALGRTTRDVGVDIITVNAAGIVTKVVTAPLPRGVTLDRIACTSLTACELGGTDVFASPPPLEIGAWNGASLSLHRVNVPAHMTSTSLEGITCVRATCEAVGYAQHVATVTGLIVTEVNNHTFTLHTAGGDSLYGVACATVTVCYGAGFSAGGGLVLTIKSGTPGTPVSVHSDLFDVACTGTACTAVGEELPTSRSSDTYWGTYVYLSAGAVSSVVPVTQSGGFNAVARIGATTTAIGSAQGTGSEIARD